MEVALARSVVVMVIWGPLAAVMVEVELLPCQAEASVREVPL